APRRFGKSSLAEKAIKISQLPVVSLNFNVCADENDIDLLLRQGVAKLIGKAIGPIEQLIHSIKNYVSTFTPSIHFGAKNSFLELAPKKHSTAASNIEEVLLLLEKLLAEKKQRAIMLFDEFQNVGIIAKGSGVEAAIRNVAQDMHYLVIIFSGSNRSLLVSMFDDESRPLYKLCRKLYLQRIESQHYQKHLNKIAKLAWKKTLPPEIFAKIISLSGQHPYYVNYLCDVIWTECKNLPKITDIKHCWDILVEEENSDANTEISQLSLGQKKIIKYIANYEEESLMSASAIKIIGMALSSISGAIAGLLEKNFIDKQEAHYRIINPVVKYLLQQNHVIE
ncbi:MAG: ATP-binding protein, partial [Gammaproteobacteria bacterium]|nr:ATP-binding protein [Gammaproteobacteria bacterium]